MIIGESENINMQREKSVADNADNGEVENIPVNDENAAASSDKASDNSDKKQSEQKHKKESRQILAISAAVVLLLFVWGISALFGSLVKVRSIIVEGSSPYTDSVVVNASGIDIGMRINKVDPEKIEENILRRLPYISEVKVSRGMLGHVKIRIKADTAVFYSKIAGDYFALSGDFRVLEYSTVEAGFISRELIHVSLPRIKSAVLSEKLSYFDNDSEYIRDFLNAVMSAGLDGQLISVDLSDKYNISFSYNKYLVKIGRYADIEQKISWVRKMEKDKNLINWQSAVFDVSDISNPTIK